MAQKKYYILWIEGLSPANGEFVKSLTDHDYQITTKKTEAMRINYWDAQKVLNHLSGLGVSDWTLDNCLVITTYVPPGTLLDIKNLNIS